MNAPDHFTLLQRQGEGKRTEPSSFLGHGAQHNLYAEIAAHRSQTKAALQMWLQRNIAGKVRAGRWIQKGLAEREGLTSTAFVLPSTMANFCFNCQRYQSLATERRCILPISLEKEIGHILVAMVVGAASRFVSSTLGRLFFRSTRAAHNLSGF
jgi:hypothetical protein